MVRSRWVRLFVVAVLIGSLLSGCSRDPNVRKRKYLESGEQYFKKGKYAEAAIQYSSAIQVDPRFVEAHYRLGLAYVQLRRWREAYRAFNVAAELDASFIPARLELADLLLLSNQPKEAREQLDAVQALEPKNVRAQGLVGRMYLLAKDFPRAVEEFEKAKQLAPEDPSLWSACALAKLGAKQYALAEKDFLQAIQLAPSSAEAYRNLANLLRITGRGKEAEPLLQQALVKNPGSLDLHLTLADFYYQQGRLDEIDQLFAKMKARAGDFPNLQLGLGDFWMWHNEVARAAKEFEAVLAEAPNPLAQEKLISAYITLGRLEEAERLNQQILARNPKDEAGRSFRGALRHLRGDSAGAIQELRAVLKDDPSSLFANYYLGSALMAVGKWGEAEAAFLDCISYNENFMYAYEKLAQLRLNREDWDGGLAYARKVVALMPRRPNGYLLAAQAYVSKGQARRAEELLTQVAKKIAPDSGEVQELLATAYIGQGKIEAGVQEYEKVWAKTQDPIPSVNRFADALATRGQFEVAIRQVQELNASHPQAKYFETLARLYIGKGDLAAAEAACQRALSLDGSSWAAHLYLGEAYDRLRRPDQAVEQYDLAIRSQPQQILPYIAAGDVRLRQGKLDQARSYYEVARKQDPNSDSAQHLLARIWAEEGTHLDEALAIVQGLQQKFPDNPYLSDTLAWIYYKKGIYSPALSLLKRCLKQQPRNAVFHFHLGLIYQKLGERTSGQQALETALKLGLYSDRWENAARAALSQIRSKAS